MTQLTQGEDLAKFYGAETASFYANMMNDEMKKLVDDLEKVLEIVRDVDGPILDTCFGSGHMLEYLSKRSPDRALKGVDLSPAMLEVAKARCANAKLNTGDMIESMESEPDNEYAVVLNNFAFHHLNADQAHQGIQSYARILKPQGAFYFSTWEGSGPMDFGEMNMNATFHELQTCQDWIKSAGLTILSARSTPDPDMCMNAAYIIATKEKTLP